MRNPPVHWFEGLFLRPHHFQASDRYWTEVTQTSQQWDHPYGYGLEKLEISREALANYQFEVRTLRARMRDGTLVALETGEEPDRLDLRSSLGAGGETRVGLEAAFERAAKLTVFLAVPKLQMGRSNVGTPGQAERTRYLEYDQSLQDESSGGNDQGLRLKALNVRLLLSTDDLSGYEVLPIAQVERASQEQAVPRLVPDYVPPVISLEAWSHLNRDLVRAVGDIIERKMEVLSDQIVNRGIGLDSQEPGDTERILMLSQLNAAHGVLTLLSAAQGVHPLAVYVELARIVGQLSIFSRERRLTAIPPYDHDDLGPLFRQLRLRIEQLINAVRDYEFEQRYFVGVGLGMQVTLEPKWFNSDWQWFIGVNKGELSEAECRDLLSSGQLDWKFGSSRQVELLFKHRASGLQLIPVERSIRALPSRRDWLFYEVDRRDSQAWRDVQETQSLAMRLKDSLILNQDRLQGERRLVVNAQGRRATLQFALFAVPQHS